MLCAEVSEGLCHAEGVGLRAWQSRPRPSGPPDRVGLRSMPRVALVPRVRHAESVSVYVRVALVRRAQTRSLCMPRIALVRRVRWVERPLARDTSETCHRRAFGGASARLSIEASRNDVSCKEWLPWPLGSNCHASRSRISRSRRAAHAPRSFLDARDRPPWQRAPTDARRSHTHAYLLCAVARSRGRRAPRDTTMTPFGPSPLAPSLVGDRSLVGVCVLWRAGRSSRCTRSARRRWRTSSRSTARPVACVPF